ncbi:MAG: glutaminyl-peptide cyclotransferase [Myxococcota bacterium]|nr:glutaminyl-peptide cyclotransferase [Myxococcota bacterium]
MSGFRLFCCLFFLVPILWGACLNAATAGDIEIEVLASFTHDEDAYTQGLLLYDGFLYESTGINGKSTLRRVVPTTGEVVKKIDLDETYFAEGLARVENELYQLTWKSGVAIIYDIETFEEKRQYTYDGEGWGLCYDGTQLVMSDGSSQLDFRDPVTFDILSSVQVTLDGEPQTNLNELECVGDVVLANVWPRDIIVRIDKATGNINGVIDASGLLSYGQRLPEGVLNGIAYRPEKDTYYLTGKNWPKLFEVKLIEDSDTETDTGSDIDTDSDVDTDSDTDMDSDTDSDTDGENIEDDSESCGCHTVGFSKSDLWRFSALI